MAELNHKIAHATKWSSVTEVVSKLVNPIVSMVLARLLAPEAFGVVATLSIVITFAEIFTDAGFQKYIVQHDFVDDKEKYQCTIVAFWTNLSLSLLIWAMIVLFREPISNLVGCPGLGVPLAVACVSIPLAGFSSIQIALFKRDFDFRTLFFVRIVGIVVPLIVTIPLAYWFKNYWALLIGTISSNVINAIILTYKSQWKPSLYYSLSQFKAMFSFTMWTMIESVFIWLTVYIDVFLVGKYLDAYYLGLYRTSTTIVTQITGLVAGILTSVLFSSLSRLQNDRKEFSATLSMFQKMAALFVFPIGVGIFVFQDTVTLTLLGNQWAEAAGFIGLWGVMNALSLPFSQFGGEVYRSLGRPKLSTIAQVQHLLFLVPIVYFATQLGFETLYKARSLIRLELIAFNLIAMCLVTKMSAYQMLRPMLPSLIASVFMGGVGFLLLQTTPSLPLTYIYIIICGIIYFASICVFTNERNLILRKSKSLLKR